MIAGIHRAGDQRQERNADDGEPAAECSFAEPDNEHGRQANEIKQQIGGHFGVKCEGERWELKRAHPS
jgi:hypothetical protein